MRGECLSTILRLALAGCVITPNVASAQPEPAAPPDGGDCVRAVSDLNGDGVGDFVATRQSSNGQIIAYLMFGRATTAAVPDAGYIRHHAAFVLRGAAAAPFACPDSAVQAANAARLLTLPPRVVLGSKTKPLSDSPIGAGPSYSVIDLDPLMPNFADGFSSVANAINAGGEVAGRFSGSSGDRAYVYDNGAVRDLGTLGGDTSDARAINGFGQLAGFSLTGEIDTSGFVSEAFVSDGHTLTGLGMRWSTGNGINAAAQIVGEMRVQPDVDLNHAFLYQQGVAADLGTLPPLNGPAHSVALAINENTQVVGESDTFIQGIADPSRRFFARHAFLFDRGSMRDIGSLGPVCLSSPFLGETCSDHSTATSINGAGDIVGFSDTATGTHAFATADGVLRDLGTLGGSGSWAYGVNDSQQVVGLSLDDHEQFAPFLLDQGTMYNLNTLVAGASDSLPFAAYAINNFGQIAGNHHLLNPIYDRVMPGQRLVFADVLGDTLSFEYWVARGDVTACRANRNLLRLEIKIDRKHQPDIWLPAADVPGCDSSSGWHNVSIAIPDDARNTSVNVRIRVREAGRSTEPILYLRHFQTTAASH